MPRDVQPPSAMVEAPSDLIDTHVHVFDPARFPYSAARSYTPAAATVGTLRAHLSTLAQPAKAGVLLVREVDLAASLAALKSWAPDATSLQQVLVDNAAQLYGFASATEVEPKSHTH